ncbi:DUF3307 domain-containing protein [Escherichia coli]|nr:DUF3307 domain-containing protein [Escherichia coli]HCQ0858866.1 DUF3307 domain-containing protein [Escherichia coli]
MSILLVFGLLALFQIKHFLCDYIFQGKYMLGKFKEHGWFLPLTAHVAVHVLGTAIIIAIFACYIGTTWKVFFMLLAIDAVVHFVMDRVKVVGSKQHTPQDAEFWWWLGYDQMIHHFTHYVIIFGLLLL